MTISSTAAYMSIENVESVPLDMPLIFIAREYLVTVIAYEETEKLIANTLNLLHDRASLPRVQFTCSGSLSS